MLVKGFFDRNNIRLAHSAATMARMRWHAGADCRASVGDVAMTTVNRNTAINSPIENVMAAAALAGQLGVCLAALTHRSCTSCDARDEPAENARPARDPSSVQYRFGRRRTERD